MFKISYKKKYKFWVENEYFDDETKKELKEIMDNESEIEDRFYKDLEFGTGGLRGKIGAGTNRINIYTVSRATQGLADFIKDNGKEYMDKGVVIAHDSRHKSNEFAQTAAQVLAGNGIKSYLFEDLRPTPELSFAVRHLNAASGIVITASHNPSEYNGYKVYWEDGGQMVPRLANQVIDKVNEIDDFSEIKVVDIDTAKKDGYVHILGSEIDDIYVEKVKGLSVREDVNKDIKIIYTPLHGTGNLPVRRVLDELGYNNVSVVEEQEKPDPEFSTVDYPNPEDPASFKLALDLAKEQDVDIILGTDPDCDRVGVVVKNNEGKYIVLNGNQTGALMLDYLLEAKKEKGDLPSNGVMIKTIVTSELGKVIAQKFGLETIDTLTGFKYIGEKIKEFEESGDKEFIFGYEESYGYLAGTFVRDKDAVIASMLICEMAAYYSKNGLTLYEALGELYKKYGYYVEDLHSIKLEGIEGKKKIEKVMDTFRKDFYNRDSGLDIVKFYDYKEGKNTNLPKSNVLKYVFSDQSWCTLRPSGTEPKLKIYVSSNGESKQEADNRLKDIKEILLNEIDKILK